MAHRRELARQARAARGCSERQVCHIFNLHRSTYRYRAKFPSVQQQRVEEAVVSLSREHPEMGADKIGRLVRRADHRVSNQRVREVRRQEGLCVPPPRKKRRRLGISTGRHPQKASYRGHVWTWDFIHDWTLKGGSCRILSVVDEYTRECHLLHVDRHIGARKVEELMAELIQRVGAPGYIRSDNGPEFKSRRPDHFSLRNGSFCHLDHAPTPISAFQTPPRSLLLAPRLLRLRRSATICCEITGPTPGILSSKA